MAFADFGFFYEKNWRISRRLNEFSKWVRNMPNLFFFYSFQFFFRVLWTVKVHCIIGRFNNVGTHLKYNFRAHKSLLWTEGNLHFCGKLLTPPHWRVDRRLAIVIGQSLMLFSKVFLHPSYAATMIGQSVVIFYLLLHISYDF